MLLIYRISRFNTTDYAIAARQSCFLSSVIQYSQSLCVFPKIIDEVEYAV